MHVGIVANIDEQKGLWRDATIFARHLEVLGHAPTLIDFRRTDVCHGHGQRFHALLFAETLEPLPSMLPLLDKPGRIWYMVNPEWHLPSKDAPLRHVHRVICRTGYAAACRDWGGRAVVTGFESEDLGPGEFARPTEVLHPAGGSMARGSAAVLRAWRDVGREFPGARLVLADVPYEILERSPLAESVRSVRRLPEAEWRALQRRCAAHVIASEHEGWGHLLWEALSTGAHVVATDGPWWAEARHALEPVAARVCEPRGLTPRHEVEVGALAVAMRAAMSRQGRNDAGIAAARAARENFRARFAEFVAEELG